MAKVTELDFAYVTLDGKSWKDGANQGQTNVAQCGPSDRSGDVSERAMADKMKSM